MYLSKKKEEKKAQRKELLYTLLLAVLFIGLVIAHGVYTSDGSMKSVDPTTGLRDPRADGNSKRSEVNESAIDVEVISKKDNIVKGKVLSQTDDLKEKDTPYGVGEKLEFEFNGEDLEVLEGLYSGEHIYVQVNADDKLSEKDGFKVVKNGVLLNRH